MTSVFDRQFSRRRVLAGAAVAAGSLGALLADPSRTSAAATTSATRVSMVGDSLTYGSLHDQAERFASAGWAGSTIDAYGSRGIRTKVRADPHTGLTAVDSIRSRSGDSEMWVVALGTNDLGIYAAGKFQTIIALMLDHIGPQHTVLWVNVYLPTRAPRQQAWNEALADSAHERPRQLSVCDWAGVAAVHPEWSAADRVHCTRLGYAARSSMIATATSALRAGPHPGQAAAPPRRW